MKGIKTEKTYKNKQEIDEIKKQLVHSSVLVFCSLFALIFASVAWFASNNSVDSAVSKVSANGNLFELASADGTIAYLGGTLPDEYQNVENGDSYTILDNIQGIWTGGKQTIQWNMSDSSNLNNTEQKSEGLGPGASGQLQFYVIAKEDGPLNLRFELEIIPLQEPETKDANTVFNKIQNNDIYETSLRLLRGHLLFSYICNDGNQNALVDYKDGSFMLKFENMDVDNPVLVTINWFWPQTLSDVVEHTQYGTYISNEMAIHEESFFYNSGEIIDIETVSKEDEIQNDYFNNADKYIGDNIYAIILRLNAYKES